MSTPQALLNLYRLSAKIYECERERRVTKAEGRGLDLMHLSSPTTGHPTRVVRSSVLGLRVRGVFKHVVVEESDPFLAVHASIRRGREMLPLHPLSILSQ
jgi:hypothetical protein